MQLQLFILASTTVQPDPNFIIKPIGIFLGWILNAVFNFFSLFSQNMSIGLSVIVFTVIVRALMIPLALKQQKSMLGMSKLQPEMEKIKKKYGDNKDPEIQKKMQAEMTQLYSKHGVNPLSGCLPLIIQFPIFIALMFVMRQPYLFVKKLGTLYTNLATTIYTSVDLKSLPHYGDIYNLFLSKINNPTKNPFTIGADGSGLEKILNVLKPNEWTNLLSWLPTDLAAKVQPLVDQKHVMEHFATLDMQSVPGWGIAGIILLLLAVGVNFFSSWIMTRMQKTGDNNSKTMQRVMMFMMPAMMAYFTVTMPAGIGIYWLTSSTFQLCQQVLLNKFYHKNTDDTKDVKEIKIKEIPKNGSKKKH